MSKYFTSPQKSLPNPLSLTFSTVEQHELVLLHLDQYAAHVPVLSRAAGSGAEEGHTGEVREILLVTPLAVPEQDLLDALHVLQDL